MKLYRIKRISDGKYFTGASKRSQEWLKRWKASMFGTNGVFYKNEDTINKHLHNLCCDWDEVSTGPMFWEREWIKLGDTDWERLNLYEVECLTITKSHTISVSAKDFIEK